MLNPFVVKIGVGFGLVALGAQNFAENVTDTLTKNTSFTMDLATMFAAIGGIACFVYWIAKDRVGVEARLNKLDEAITQQSKSIERMERAIEKNSQGHKRNSD